VQPVDDRLAFGAEGREGKSEKRGDDRHLEDIASDEGSDESGRD